VADNYVSIRIKADDSAKPDLTELRERLKELAGQVATARAEVDDAAADARLADLEAKLAAVDKAISRPRIDMAGAQRALAQVTAVGAALQKMDDDQAAAAEAAAAREAAARQAEADSQVRSAQLAAEAEIAAAEEAAAAREQAAQDAADKEEAAAQEAADAQVLAAKRAELGVDDLQKKIGELNEDVGVARLDVDDKDASLELISMQDRLAALSATVARPDVDAAGILKASGELAALKAELAALGEDSGGGAGSAWGERFRAAAGGPLNDLSAQLGGSGLGKEAEKSGAEDGGLFGNSFVQTFLGGKKTVIVGGIASALAAVPALGAVAGVGLVGALGGVIADKIPAVAANFSHFGDQMLKTVESAVRPLVPFIDSSLRQLSGFVSQIQPLLSGLFKSVGPMLQPLVYGLEGLVGGLLPGLQSILTAAAPAMGAFSNALAMIGVNLGRMFQVMAPAVSASAGVMQALLNAVSGLLPVIGQLGAIMAGALAPVLQQVIGAVHALSPAFAVVAKVVAAFAQAFLGNLQGGLSAVIGLIGHLAPVVTRLGNVFLQVFNLMNNRGVFNDIEDAIEGLVGPIATIVAALAGALMPVIPPVVAVLGKLAGILQGALVAAVTALAPVIVQLAGFAGQLLTAMLPLLPAVLQIASALLGGLVQALVGCLPAVSALLAALTPMVPVVAQVASIIADVLADGLSRVIPLIARLAPVALAIVGAMRLWAAVQALLNILMDANPIGLLVLAVGALIIAVVEIVKHWQVFEQAGKAAFHVVSAAAEDAWNWVKSHWPLILEILTGPIGLAVAFIVQHWQDIVHGTESAFDAVTHAVSTAIDWVKSHWPLLLAILTGPIGLAVLYIVNHWHQITSATADLYHSVIAWVKRLFGDFIDTERSGFGNLIGMFRALPGRILSAVGNLGSLLYNSGQKVIQGLINGVTSMVGAVGNAISNVVGEIKDHLPFSPARKGPLSGAGAPVNSGRSIARQLAQGISSGVGGVSASMAQLTGAVRAGAPAVAGAGGGQLQLTLIVQKTGDKVLDDIFEGIRLEARHKGGGGTNSVQKAFGQRW